MHNDGEDFSPNSLNNECLTATIQPATDCFRLGRIFNHFRRLYLLSMQSLISVENSESKCSSINSSNKNEDANALNERHDDDEKITEGDKDNLLCEINTHTDSYRLCKAKPVHDAVLGKIDASPKKKPLIATEAPHLDTKSLTAKLDDIAKTVDLYVSTTLAE